MTFVIHEGAGRVNGPVTGLGWLGVPRSVTGGVRESVPVIHSVALGGPECRAGLEGSIKWAAVRSLGE